MLRTQSVREKSQVYTIFTLMIPLLFVLIKMTLILEALKLLKTLLMFFVKEEWIEEMFWGLLLWLQVVINLSLLLEVWEEGTVEIGETLIMK